MIMSETAAKLIMAESDHPRRELLALIASLKARIHLDLALRRKITYMHLKGDEHAINAGSGVTAADATTLQDLRLDLGDCHRCPLGKTRTHIVFGEGNPQARLAFVGEAPGADEDAQGRPFVGRAGQLLTKIIEAMGLTRRDVYICNILKCRPPGNRNPKPEEILTCEPFLVRQLQIIQPKVICALGTFAAHTLLKTEISISLLRGRFHTYQGIYLMPTYHPAYLLRNPGAKKQVWEDMQIIMKAL
jgi:uracil-DNA glycosylase